MLVKQAQKSKEVVPAAASANQSMTSSLPGDQNEGTQSMTGGAPLAQDEIFKGFINMYSDQIKAVQLAISTDMKQGVTQSKTRKQESA